MTEPGFTESIIEQAALAWLESVGWRIRRGVEFAPGSPRGEREDYGQILLTERVQDALHRLNPDLPADTREDALRRLRNPEGSELTDRNRSFHRLLVDGVPVEYRDADGNIRGTQARILDFDRPKNNDWLAINQLTVRQSGQSRRLDVVLFVNGLPLGVIELKNATDETATIWSAYEQLQTYKAELPELFTCNELLLVSDGLTAKVGTLTAGREWMKPWKTISGETLADVHTPELQVAIAGILEPGRFLALIRDFLVFESGDGPLVKKMAGYHQFHAVRIAVDETVRACGLAVRDAAWAAESAGRYESRPRRGGQPGDRRVGVVWHTQGSGKSLTMAFYAGRIVREPAMENPTLVVLTDRNDLDDQLFATFARCQDLLRQPPVQARDRADLREKLAVPSGGVVFTTLQKFMPEERGDRYPLLSDRRNVVVIADEAHRSHYDLIKGLAANLRDALPNASFIGFTGTPVELKDANTRAVFGEYISVYDIHRAVEDKATVPIYYESRLAKLNLDEAERPKIDPDFEEVTEGEEIERKEQLKSRWAQLEAIVGADGRLKLVARDLVEHFEKRLDAVEGKGMVVCMSRRICADLYREIVLLRPAWEAPGGAGDDLHGSIKVVMTGSASDPKEWQAHIRSKGEREALAKRFRDPNDPLKLVLVRDMWLTGFDAPSLHTMYLDKPMRGHGLMQAIARVNRVFKDKPGGLVVDYLGLAHELKLALATYTESKGEGRLTYDLDEAAALLREKYEVCRGFFAGPVGTGALPGAFDWSLWRTGSPPERLGVLGAAAEHVVAQENGRDRYLTVSRELSQAFALAVPHDETQRLRDDVAFFQEVRAVLAKRLPGEAQPAEELDFAVRQILSRAVAPEGVVDLFAAAGLKKPDLSVLSEEFLAEVQGMPHRNLAIELLRRLLQGELRTRGRKNLVQARSFSEMLEAALRRYQNRSIEAARVIEELIALAREMREADLRRQELGLNEDEWAFYGALGSNDSAVQVLGDDTLRDIARELVEKVRANVTIDWTMRENVRAQLRVLVKRILRRHGYPPDRQEKATKTVLEQAALLSADWAMVA